MKFINFTLLARKIIEKKIQTHYFLMMKSNLTNEEKKIYPTLLKTKELKHITLNSTQQNEKNNNKSVKFKVSFFFYI